MQSLVKMTCLCSKQLWGLTGRASVNSMFWTPRRLWSTMWFLLLECFRWLPVVGGQPWRNAWMILVCFGASASKLLCFNLHGFSVVWVLLVYQLSAWVRLTQDCRKILPLLCASDFPKNCVNLELNSPRSSKQIHREIEWPDKQKLQLTAWVCTTWFKLLAMKCRHVH